MIRLCMIGNSHVAAMRLAWSAAAPGYPDIDAVIYGAHAKNLVTASISDDASLGCDGAPFWAFSKAGEPSRAISIPLGSFDRFVIVGCDFGPIDVFRAYRRYSFSGLKGRRRQLLTRDLFVRAVMQNVNESAALVLAELIGRTVSVPIYLVPTPLPAEKGYLDPEKITMEPYQAASAAGDGEALMSVYDEICTRLAARGLTVFPQHPATMASPISTRQVYSENSVRLRADRNLLHPEDDYFHMNEDYGAIMWKEVAAAVRGPSAQHSIASTRETAGLT